MNPDAFPNTDESEVRKRNKLLFALAIVLGGIANADSIAEAVVDMSSDGPTNMMNARSFDQREYSRSRSESVYRDTADYGSRPLAREQLPNSLEPYFANETIEQLIEAQRQWTLKYIHSPMYRHILTEQIEMQMELALQSPSPEYIVSEVDKIIAERSARVSVATVKYLASVIDPETGMEAYGQTIVDTAGSPQVDINTTMIPTDPSAGVHEMEHVAHGTISHPEYSFFSLYPQVSMYLSGLAMGKSPEQMIKYVHDRRAYLVGAEQYHFRTWEVMSFVTQLKFYADLFRIMDPCTEEFTLEHYELLKSRMLKFLPDNSYLRVYFTKLPAQNLIELCNSVAVVEEDELFWAEV